MRRRIVGVVVTGLLACAAGAAESPTTAAPAESRGRSETGAAPAFPPPPGPVSAGKDMTETPTGDYILLHHRLPEEHRDGSTPAVCTPLPVAKGWLTDADLDHPSHEPAPYDAYAGNKDHAFWHFDEEMARAIHEYHRGRFLLPDPTKENPVPADWPPVKK